MPNPSVATILAEHVSLSTSCIDRLYLNGYVPRLQSSGQLCAFLCDHLGNRHFGNKTQIAGARGRAVGDEAGDVVSRVQVDLLLPEAQRRPPFAEMDDLHAEHPRVEIDALLRARRREDDVVEMIDQGRNYLTAPSM